MLILRDQKPQKNKNKKMIEGEALPFLSLFLSLFRLILLGWREALCGKGLSVN